jgi:DNA-directed RNA polymerase subunit RPC12/RpoP
MIKFECGHCGQPIEAPNEMLNMEVDCPGCLQKVKVRETLKADTSENPLEFYRAQQAARSVLTEAEKITCTASGFVFWAILLVIAGCIGLAFLLLRLFTGGGDGVPYVLISFCVFCFGLAFWFFLLGQIIHIRALLAKK